MPKVRIPVTYLKAHSARRPERIVRELEREAADERRSSAAPAEQSPGDAVREPEAASSEECDTRLQGLQSLQRLQGQQRPQGPHPVAGEGAQATREALLSDVLQIADNLELALAVAEEDTPIRQGVAITHSGVLQLLRKHGIERIEAGDGRFDPHWQEAIAVVPAKQVGVDPGTVVEVTQSGYRRGERLFRPARVVVAQ